MERKKTAYEEEVEKLMKEDKYSGNKTGHKYHYDPSYRHVSKLFSVLYLGAIIFGKSTKSLNIARNLWNIFR